MKELQQPQALPPAPPQSERLAAAIVAAYIHSLTRGHA
jgi:hypothetical protein